MKKILFVLAALFLAALGQPLRAAAAPAASPAPVTWDTAAEILARIKAPTFPARDFPITAYGAVTGGTTDATAAIAQAITAVAASSFPQANLPPAPFISKVTSTYTSPPAPRCVSTPTPRFTRSCSRAGKASNA